MEEAVGPGHQTKGRVLVVDDDKAMREFLEQGLATLGFGCDSEANGQDALTRMRGADYDAVVTDLRMGGMSGHDLCREIVARHADVPVILLTAFGTLDAAVEAMRAGAYDFLSKPVHLEALSLAVGRAIERRKLRREVRRLQRTIDVAQGFGEVLGESPAMQKVYAVLERITDSGSSVLVQGESGTGKEVVARELHRRGRRPSGPFVAINCAALPGTLLEAELFGHERGSFTGADESRSGLLVQANGGTLFLDEIGDMSLDVQAKMLRTLQERTVRPVGGRREIPFDARIIAATNRDLETLIEEGRFREDLYFRINVIQIELPPLRARGTDVLLLAQKFLEAASARTGKAVVGIATEAAQVLMRYRWPGNVRELQNCIERAVALAQHDHLTVDDLPNRIVDYKLSHVVVAAENPAELVTIDEMERRYILRVLEAFNGNRTLAAKTLGLDRTTLWRKLERYGAGTKT
jgi:two-component system response regulator HydG